MQTDEADEQVAISAAEKWLALVDSGDYAQSWNQSASSFRYGVETSTFFKRGVSEQQWQSSAAAVLAQLGKAESRRLRDKGHAEDLAGEPSGEYFVIEYKTLFGARRGV